MKIENRSLSNSKAITVWRNTSISPGNLVIPASSFQHRLLYKVISFAKPNHFTIGCHHRHGQKPIKEHKKNYSWCTQRPHVPNSTSCTFPADPAVNLVIITVVYFPLSILCFKNLRSSASRAWLKKNDCSRGVLSSFFLQIDALRRENRILSGYGNVFASKMDSVLSFTPMRPLNQQLRWYIVVVIDCCSSVWFPSADGFGIKFVNSIFMTFRRRHF